MLHGAIEKIKMAHFFMSAHTNTMARL